MTTEHTANSTERTTLNADWLFYVALLLWCAGRSFFWTLIVYQGLFTEQDMISYKFACLVLLLLRELALVWGAVRQSFGEFPRTSRQFMKGLGTLARDSYVRMTLVSLPVLALLFFALKANMNDAWPQYILLFAFCARSLDFHAVARVAAVVSGALLVGIVGGSLVGVIQNIFLTIGHTGWCLGFKFPLHPPALVMNLTICLLVCMVGRRNQRDFVLFALLAALNLVFFVLCRARSAFVCSEMAILLCAAWSWQRTHGAMKRLAPLLVASMILVFVFSIVTAVYHGQSGPLAWMNSLLRDRIRFSQEALSRFAITPFGQNVPMQGAGGFAVNPEQAHLPYFYIDNYFIQVLMKHGVITLAAVLAAYTLAAWHAWKTGDFVLLACIAATALFMFSDDHSYYLQWNVLLLCLWPSWMIGGKQSKARE